jgi:hypothetical protein
MCPRCSVPSTWGFCEGAHCGLKHSDFLYFWVLLCTVLPPLSGPLPANVQGIHPLWCFNLCYEHLLKMLCSLSPSITKANLHRLCYPTSTSVTHSADGKHSQAETLCTWTSRVLNLSIFQNSLNGFMTPWT